MKTLEGPLLFAAVLLAGCGTTRNVAETSYHVTRAGAVGSYKVARAGLLQGSSSCRRGFISRRQRAGALRHGKSS